MKLLYVFFSVLLSFPVLAKVDPALLSQETQKRFERVPEFDFIIKEANKMGIKVYLFGGTASAFAHYVRWDLEREAGDDKYQPERFDYDFTNIYRGNQDLDIVVDGTAEQAKELAEIMQRQYPHFVGSRQAWEVRLLREKIGDKRALLNDQDFKNQHSDTNSIGVLNLNPSNKDEIIYRDLRDWKNPKSEFLIDTSEARIKYLFSKLHDTTERYQEGKNPPVLSAIRYIAKLTQYEVTGTVEDLDLVTKIIGKTNFFELSSYAQQKAEEFTLKALLNSPDIEYAWNLLEETGLRKKMIESKPNHSKEDKTLSWWLSKEPLRSFELGSYGKTAQEIFETDEIIVAHETDDFRAYENITRSTHGGANVFISRNGANGEAAAYGDGFYTQLGQKGARGSGLTIRFYLDPMAREGHDFTLANNNTYIVVINKKALKLIPEDISMSLYDFFVLLNKGQLSSDDKGLIEKLNRKFSRYEANYEEMKMIYDSFSKKDLTSEPLIRFWFNQKNSADFPEIVNELKIDDLSAEFISALGSDKSWRKLFLERFDLLNILNTADSKKMLSFITHFLSKEEFYHHPEFVAPLLRRNKDDITLAVIQHVLSQPTWENHPKLLKLAFKNQNLDQEEQVIFFALAKHVFSNPQMQVHKDILIRMIYNDHHRNRDHYKKRKIHYKTLTYIAQHTLSQSFWKNHPEVYEVFFDIATYVNNQLDKQIEYIFSQEHMVNFPEILKQLIQNHTRAFNAGNIVRDIFSSPIWTKHPEILKLLWDLSEDKSEISSLGSIKTKIIEHVLMQPHWSDQTEIFQDAVAKFPEFLAEHVFSKEHVENVTFLKLMINDTRAHKAIIQHVFPQKRWKNIEWVNKVFKSSEVNHALIVKHIMSLEHWATEEEFLIKLIEAGHADKELVQYVFTQPFWQENPLISNTIDLFIEEKRASEEIIKYILSQERWFNLDWVNALKGDHYSLMVEHVFSQPHFESYHELLFEMAQDPGQHEKILKIIFQNYQSDQHKYIVEYIIENSLLDDKVIEHLSQNPEWFNNHPDLVIKIMVDGVNDFELQKYIFSNQEWKKHPVLRKYLKGQAITLNNLRARNRELPFSE